MTPIHKIVPAAMAHEYTALGWTISKREGRTVLLIWTKAENPP